MTKENNEYGESDGDNGSGGKNGCTQNGETKWRDKRRILRMKNNDLRQFRHIPEDVWVNGVAERKNRMVVEVARAMLEEKSFPSFTGPKRYGLRYISRTRSTKKCRCMSSISKES